MRKIAETWQQARQETARALQGLPAQHALPVFSFRLDDWHAERLSRAVAAMRSREHQRFRSQSIWRQWTHLLLTLIVWIKIRRPLRKKSAIETVKNLMRAAARPYQFRCAVKHFMQAVLLVQRAMRHQAQIFKVMQNRIFKPLVWATETQLICDAFRMRKAEAAAKIESQMHAFKVKHWEEDLLHALAHSFLCTFFGGVPRRSKCNVSELLSEKCHVREMLHIQQGWSSIVAQN